MYQVVFRVPMEFPFDLAVHFRSLLTVCLVIVFPNDLTLHIYFFFHYFSENFSSLWRLSLVHISSLWFPQLSVLLALYLGLVPGFYYFMIMYAFTRLVVTRLALVYGHLVNCYSSHVSLPVKISYKAGY